MTTAAAMIDFLLEQLATVPGIAARKMFGEYALYADSKVVALVCDDQLYLKPTPSVRAALASPVEAPPYPGARPHFLISDELDDPDRLADLIRRAAADLPAPKPRAPRKRKVSR